MDFNYGNSTNVAAHKSYTSTQLADGTPYTNGTSVSIEINDLPIGNYYFSTTARNELAGRASLSSAQYNWGANLQANSVTYTNMSNTVTVTTPLASYGYEVPNTITNGYTLPVNVNTFGNVATGAFGVPKYLNTTYFGGGGIYPYYQGNSTTSAGYANNSTAQYIPGRAALLTVNNGDLGWYVTEYKAFTSGTYVSSSESLNISSDFQVVANTDNTLLQIAPFITYSSNPGLVIVDTSGLASYILMAGVPVYISLRDNLFGGNVIDGGGYVSRILTSARVDWVFGGLSLSKQKK
jgi:hypothetical protein